jgi:hypothetical protein
MKITVKQLRTIIREEVEHAMTRDYSELAFRPGMPNSYKGPKDFDEFMDRVNALGVSLEDFKGKSREAARALVSGVYRRTYDTLTSVHVYIEKAIVDGNMEELKSLVDGAPEQIKQGDKWLQAQMDSLRSKD